MKICFVVHRYAPYPGGSEYYVQQMAEECLRRKYQVTVVAGEHKGNLNGVFVSSDAISLSNQDLVVVHGGDVGVQNFVLSNAKNINSPILYLLIKPSESQICLQALKDVKYVGCSTLEDWDHVKKWNVVDKSHKVTHGISVKKCTGMKGFFKNKYGIKENTKMFLSCGGYWPNKKMIELVNAFRKANLENTVLVTTGYDNRHGLMPIAHENVIPLMIEDPSEVKNAIADADCYIMNSDAEGFGLVLLESMLNKTPWISRNIAAAKMFQEYGLTYDTEDQLIEILKTYDPMAHDAQPAYDYVMSNFLIKNTIDDIEKVLL